MLTVHHEIALGIVARAGDFSNFAIHPQTGDSHHILGQGAGLVRADDRGRTERLDGGQAADQRIAVDHLAHAQRQTDRYHGCQAFRHGSDGQADRDHETIQKGRDHFGREPFAKHTAAQRA